MGWKKLWISYTQLFFSLIWTLILSPFHQYGNGDNMLHGTWVSYIYIQYIHTYFRRKNKIKEMRDLDCRQLEALTNLQQVSNHLGGMENSPNFVHQCRQSDGNYLIVSVFQILIVTSWYSIGIVRSYRRSKKMIGTPVSVSES